MKNAADIQKEYYAKTATHYDNMHVSAGSDGDHDLALIILSSFIKKTGIQSVLDVGAGTGRTIQYLAANHPGIKAVGIEPVKELREQAYKKGVPESMLIEGNGSALGLNNNEFDLVCAFGVLHHVGQPGIMIDEMLRVAKKGIFISDNNNFGQGSYLGRTVKQIINFFGLWKFFEFIRTKGKMYHVSEGDGLFYSYSLFNNYKQIKNKCTMVHLFNITGNNVNFYRGVSHLALMGLKKNS
jgi:ubiquinone/menaquinone biosynthesis C-methylase UbiE